MRKRHYFHICRAWGLRSDVWARTRKRPAEGAVARRGAHRPRAAAQQAAAPAPSVCCAADSAALLVARDLTPHATATLASTYTPWMLAAFAAEPQAPLATLCLTSERQMLRLAQLMQATCLSDAALLRRAADALCSSGDGALPVWRLGARVPQLAERTLASLALVANAFCDSQLDAAAPDRGVAAHVGRALSAPERAHMNDKLAVCDGLQRFLAAAEAALAQTRVRGAAAYLDVSLAVVQLVSSITGGCVAANGSHVAEFAAPLARHGAPWPSPFPRYLVRSGFLQAMPLAPAELAALLQPPSSAPPLLPWQSV